MSNPYSPDDVDMLRAALATGQNSSGEGPPPELVDALQRNGYISQQQARNPGSIPWKNGAPDWSNPQFKGLPPLTTNSGPDRVAAATATASAPDLRYGSSSGATVNRAPPPAAAPTQPQVPELTATPFNPYAGGGGGDEDQGPRAPAPVAVPERWVNTRAPEDRTAIAAAQGQQQEGVSAQAAAESEEADQAGDIAQRGVEDYRIQQLQDQREIARQKSALDAHMQQLQDRADAISKQTIDPMHVFGEKGSEERTGGQVLAAIASGLGAAGAALTHTENTAAKTIQAKIDADISAQHAKIQQSKEGLETQRGLLADKLKLFGDLPKAQAAARQEMLMATSAEIDAMAKKYQSPVIQARAQQLKAQLAEAAARDDASVKQYQPAHMVGGAGYGVSDVKPDEVVTLPDGRQVTVPTADREQVVGALRQHQMVGAAAQHARQLLSVPLTQRGPGWVKDYDATQEVLAKAELVGGGKGGKGLIEMNAAAGGGRTLTFTPGVEQALRTLEKGSAQNAQAAADNTAQYEVEPQLMVDPRTGMQERKYRIKGQYKRSSQEQAPPPGFKPVGGGGVAGNTAGASSAAGAGAAMADEISPVDRDARFGELGVLNRPDGDISTEISITVTDPRLNGGRPTNIPTLVKGQVGVDQLLAGKRPTELQQEMAVRRAIERQKSGANLPSFKTIPEAVSAAELRTHSKGNDVPYTQGGS